MIDARLLVPAAGSWAAAVLVTVLLRGIPDLVDRHSAALHAALVAAGSGLLIGLLLVGLALVRGLPRGRASPVLVAGAAVLVGALAAALHIAALTPPVLTTWTMSRATAVVTGVVSGEPVDRSAGVDWRRPALREVRLATDHVSARGQGLAIEVPVLVHLPAGVDLAGVGSRVQVTGRLSPPPPTADVAAVLTSDGSAAHVVVVGSPGLLDRVTSAMRRGLRDALTGVPRAPASLVAGLAIGDESGQPAELAADMRASGLSHLTAVSGGNVSIIVVGVLTVAVLLRLGLVVRVGLALGALVAFVELVGAAPSVIRAAVMAGLVLVGLLVGGRRAGPSVLGAAVLMLVVLAPGVTATWGFALSAGATLGVVLLAAPVQARLAGWRRTRRWPPAIREGLGVTIAAQWATTPLLVAMGGAVGWVSLPANLLAMPVVGPITVLGLLAATVSPVLPALGALLAHAAALPAAWIAWVALTCAGLPAARLSLPSGWWGLAILVAALAAAWLLRRSLRRAYPTGVPRPLRAVAAVVTAVIVSVYVLLPPARRSWPPPDWLMIMCDVGQGDGLLIRAGESAAVVVDAGPDAAAIDRCLDDASVATVPAVVLTHFHADHVGGLAGVFDGRAVGAILVNPIRDPPEEAAMVDATAAAHGLRVQAITAGDTRVVGAVAWRSLWPRRVIHVGSVPNNASIVLVVDVGGRRLLLMGDVEPEAQAAIGPDLIGLNVDVMKVPHHGSRYQSPELTTWAPAPVALISVGAGNDYGHPAPETIAAWRAIGALVARTDENGDCAVVPADASGVAVVVRRGMLRSS